MNTFPMRAAIYARSATEPSINDTFGNTPIDQIQKCRAYCEERGYSIVEDLVIFEIASGVSYWRERAGFARILEGVKKKEFDVLVISDFDRLSRNMTHFSVIVDELKEAGIEIDCVREGLWEQTPQATFSKEAWGVIHQIESEQLAKRKSNKRS